MLESTPSTTFLDGTATIAYYFCFADFSFGFLLFAVRIAIGVQWLFAVGLDTPYHELPLVSKGETLAPEIRFKLMTVPRRRDARAVERPVRSVDIQ